MRKDPVLRELARSDAFVAIVTEIDARRAGFERFLAAEAEPGPALGAVALSRAARASSGLT